MKIKYNCKVISMKQLNNIVDDIMYLMNEMNYKECSVSLSQPFKNLLRSGISLSNTHLYPTHLCIVPLNVLRSSKLRHLRFLHCGRFPFLIPSIAVSLMACWSFRTRMKFRSYIAFAWGLVEYFHVCFLTLGDTPTC